ncbi:GlcG/HbpS family heme-binding protein [Marinomonas fungiae]|uniref:GlcG/HbpS family heme-binding protein n=1 Tax=Marinomonas fungiae TaxID=1137284 RepID=UPI003A920186
MTTYVTTQTNLTTQAAIQMGMAAIDRAQSLNIHISLTIVDTTGLPLASLRMNQSPLISVGVAENKAYTALSFRRPTRDWQTSLAHKQTVLAALQSEPKFTYLGGGLPVVINDEVVGAIGVSGGSEDQDIDCAQHAIQILLG